MQQQRARRLPRLRLCFAAGSGAACGVRAQRTTCAALNARHTCRPAQQEEDARRKQLKSYCGLLLEEQEEEVVEALTSDQFSAAGERAALRRAAAARCSVLPGVGSAIAESAMVTHMAVQH